MAVEISRGRTPSGLELLDQEHGIVVKLQSATTPGIYILDTEIAIIGRDDSCHIMIQRPIVSRNHARITREGSRYLLSDLGSTNGTFVNGQRISAQYPYLIGHDDIIGFGHRVGIVRFIDNDRTQAVLDEGLHWNPKEQRFYLKGQPLDLPPSQEKLLAILYERHDTLVSQKSCIEAVWGNGLEEDYQRLMQLVSDMRKSIAKIDAPMAAKIENIRGKGYKLILTLGAKEPIRTNSTE